MLKSTNPFNFQFEILIWLSIFINNILKGAPSCNIKYST